MKKLVLEYIGTDYWSRSVYKDENDKLFKDVNCDDSPIDLCTVCGGFEGEPDTPISVMKRYQGYEIVITGRDNEPTKEEKSNYAMLGRLKRDCDYYLGNGDKNSDVLWSGNVTDQIMEMKNLYNSFSIEKKPEWLTWEDILNYEKNMS